MTAVSLFTSFTSSTEGFFHYSTSWTAYLSFLDQQISSFRLNQYLHLPHTVVLIRANQYTFMYFLFFSFKHRAIWLWNQSSEFYQNCEPSSSKTVCAYLMCWMVWGMCRLHKKNSKQQLGHFQKHCMSILEKSKQLVNERWIQWVQMWSFWHHLLFQQAPPFVQRFPCQVIFVTRDSD